MTSTSTVPGLLEHAADRIEELITPSTLGDRDERWQPRSHGGLPEASLKPNDLASIGTG